LIETIGLTNLCLHTNDYDPPSKTLTNVFFS